ncbi:rhodanese-like domain-containing protein [Roseovarius autotrophicus]|uniref:rhodanese-like domain-containing protein n=1 Tax=Roseovarius autotrophicus TaxID=2824121 RepID=UPI0019F4D4B3|nr:rhodanese-like domain-containing protein [Roseovarius autotrophicus]MBE0452347.1 sulfurtransferase [Roseovarius sp.]
MTALPRRAATALLALGLALSPMALVAEPLTLSDPVAADSLPASKQIAAGLYITAADAARVLEANPNVALVDVRTPAEIALIGYATPTAAHIPAQFLAAEPEFSKGSYKMVDNPGFIQEFVAWLASDAARGIDTVLVTCRSGSRSATAIAKLAAAGVSVDLYNIVDGFEGDRGENGARDLNGWRNAGLPWTYKIREGLRPGHN